MIKVNQITKSTQAARLSKRIDLAGISVTKQEDVGAPYVDVDTALSLGKLFEGIPLSISFRRDEPLELSEITEVQEALDAKYFEFSPIDFVKKEQFERQLARLSKIASPKIANGFFAMKDDCGLIRDFEPYEALADIGVELFQLEVDSAVDPGFKLRGRDLARLEELFERFPVLVCDRVTGTKDYPLKSPQGFFFNIAATGDARNYDYSVARWKESEIMRILMRR